MMATDPLFDQALILQTGAVAPNGTVMVVAIEQEKQDVGIRNSHLLIWESGNWTRVASYDFLCVRIVYVSGATCGWVALGEAGDLIDVSLDGAIHEGRLFRRSKPGGRGLMRGMCSVDGALYSVGMRRQVFARHGDYSIPWTDEGAEIANWPEFDVPGFESIAGIGRNLYVVGWNGEVAIRREGRWQGVQSPTNVILTGVTCGPDGSVYACGQRGTLLKGRGAAWEVLDMGTSTEDYWDITWHADRLYVTSLRSLYTIEKGRLGRVDFAEEDSVASFYHLSTAERFICSIGSFAVRLFDGRDWKALELP